MNRIAKHTLFVALASIACLAWAHPLPGAPEPGAATMTKKATLYAEDFLRQTVSLATGEYGRAIHDHRVVNVDSELDFGTYYANQLLAGVQGAQVGSLYDLGTSEDLAARYGYQETVGGGQGFASIHFDNGQLVILEDYADQTYQFFVEGSRFLHSATPSHSRPIDVYEGHIYLARIQDLYDPDFLRFAKLLVTDHQAPDQVTVVWQEILP